MGRQVKNLGLRELADFDGIVEVEARHDTRARGRTDAEECFQGALNALSETVGK